MTAEQRLLRHTADRARKLQEQVTTLQDVVTDQQALIMKMQANMDAEFQRLTSLAEVTMDSIEHLAQFLPEQPT